MAAPSRRNSIVTRASALVALLLIGSAANADPIGKVSDASGLLLARTATGAVKVLVVGSSVEEGETLFTRENTYALVSLNDQSSAALGPDTELTIATYSFHEAGDPPSDSAALKLARGRVRVSSGVLGARHPDRFTLTAGATTVDIGRSTFIATYIPPTSNALASRDFDFHAPGRYQTVALHLSQNLGGGANNGGLNPGLYVQVLDGMINVSNGGGAQNFAAGQFGFTPGFTQPPVILPSNPGLQFTPPPSFSSTTGGTQNGNGGGKPGDVDCIVR